ncbi:hypothetical protein G647_07105 [Cladophialophora carrionii CBS 160.54]|uniref:Phosphoribosyltransferase domain-containing protein n=1 Tax=Cladophialophora carrionii CBS 160.54 TaxID=1279043 RepID=V9D391_9EURO|nr:uncharacterized protein G647_07105 [Cladophialophora carrionii CBS 160.54]ETI20763.1 hypothetical protein G647_07105 [Cladophialophora carrionii CBS 160.54]
MGEGGGRLADGFVVTAAVKTSLVSRLQNVHSLETWAFGDSVLDLGMLATSDRAIVVVGDAEHRSSSMEAALEMALDNGSFQGKHVCQVVMASGAPPRLNATKLPVTILTNPDFMQAILSRRDNGTCVDVCDLEMTNEKAAKILMTPTRDASPTVLVPVIVGVEEYQIPHVQGNFIAGHHLLDELRTVVVALMRGSEPMALGVNDAFPLAALRPANHPEDITEKHLQMMRTIILVDSVVNSGRVVQPQVVDKIKSSWVSLKYRSILTLSLIALRL